MPRAAPRKHRFNPTYIRRLPKRAKAYLVWDTRQQGLVIRVLPSGYKTWLCIYRFNGRPVWYPIAAAAAISLDQARVEANRIMYRVTQGHDPAAERRAQRGAGTFDDLATRYRAYAERKNKSWKQSDALIKRYLLPRWGKLAAAAITRADVKALLAKIEAPILANQVLASASAMFAWAIKEEVGGVTVNPCKGVERNETNERERVLTEAEIPRFWAAFDATGLTNSMALKMILLTGQRPGEVCAMRTEHIADGWWTLPGAPLPALGWPGTKNAATHKVWLPAPAQAIIAEMENTGFVFPGARVPALGAAMRAVCKALEVTDPARPHDLRRTHGTTIISLRFGRPAMNRIQNHKEGGIADVYDRFDYSDENKTIMDATATKIMGLISPEPVPSNVVTAQFRQK